MFGLSITLFWGISIYLAGIATVFVGIWYWFNIQEIDQPILSRKKSLHETKLPDSLIDLVQNTDSYKRRETCLALNLILQFFFQERRYDIDISRWLTNLLAQEFKEILQHRALSKIINKMEIQDLNLGNNFPVMKSVIPLNIQFVKNSSLLQKVEISVELEYTGGFQIAVDAISKLSKKTVVKIKVVRLSGKGCLELSRYPFTHWSFSFYEEPESQFEVDSTVLGRQIPRFKTIIINQLRNVLKRKHTLPYYKLRSAPLIKRPSKLATTTSKSSQVDDKTNTDKPNNDAVSVGILHVTIMKCSRLQPLLVGSTMYFSLTLTEVPLVCAYETPVGIWIVQDVYVNKPHSTPVGILLRNADDNSQIVETVNNKSVAYLAGLRKNDIILAVNNIPLVSGSQAAKLFASSYASSATSTISSHSSSSTTFKKGQSSQEMCIRIKRLIFTDHKRGSFEPKPFDPLSCSEERGGVPSKASSPPSTQSTPVSVDDFSESSCVLGDLHLERSLRMEGNVDDKPFIGSIGSRHLADRPGSRCSTPASSRSNSPEPRPSRIAATNVSTFPTSEDKPLLSETSSTEMPLPPSAPIQIPQNHHAGGGDELQNDHGSNRPSMSAPSSHAGTPTFSGFEFNPSAMAPGTPVLKMDARLQTKKFPFRSRPVAKHFETAPVEGCCDPILGNEFKFMVDAESKYLNICVWSRHSNASDIEKQPTSSEKFSSAKEVINKLRKREGKETSEKEPERKTWSKDTSSKASPSELLNPMTGHPDHALVGFANLDIAELIPATKLNSQGCVTKLVSLEPADPNCPETADHPLLPHKGFHPAFCYGDVMVAVVHQSLDKLGTAAKNGEKGLGLSPLAAEEECMTDGTVSEDDDLSVGAQEDATEERDHVFKRTHFNSATQCNFCKKKIWLKDAYQCSECGIICHKKCMLRCEQATVCDFGGLRYREIRDPVSREVGKPTPEIIMTSATSSNSIDSKDALKRSQSPSPQSPRHTLGSFLSHISVPSGSLKRTGSAQNLAPPTQGYEPGISRSLPPSPQHTPRPSRKNSLSSENPFAPDEDADGVSSLETLLKRLVSCPLDEKLVSLARESAHQLYAHLPHQERLAKIKEELEVLQGRVDREGEIRMGLALQEKEASEKKDAILRTKLSLLISECDTRTQALALLTMHYFTALQTAQQKEEMQQQQETEEGSPPL